MTNPTLDWIHSLFPPRAKQYFFVEAGAHDGVGDSQTKALEDEGWTGICVEPSSAFAGLQASRKCRVDNRCLWKVDGVQVPFRQVAGNSIELSGIEECFRDGHDRTDSRTFLKDAVSLPTLLAEHQAPDIIEFLGLDTEGSEYDILLGHNFDRYLFLAITVEHNGVSEQRGLIRKLLTSKGYVLSRDNEIEDS
ncbi:MAG: FkbM family methyltransferase, partial [bacterium]